MNDAGVNNLYAISNTTDEVKKALSNDFRMIENWFHENVMVLNAKKKKILLRAFRKPPSRCLYIQRNKVTK